MPTEPAAAQTKKYKPADVALVIGILFMVGIGAWMIVRENMNAAAPANLPDAFVYDIEDLRKIDPALINFNEDGNFPTGLESLLCLSLHDDLIYVGGEGGLKVFEKNGTLVRHLVRDRKVSSVWVKDANTIFTGINNQVVIYDGEGTRGDSWKPFADNCNLRSMTGNADTLYVADAANRVIYACGFDGSRKADMANNSHDGLVVPGPHLDLHWDDKQQLLYVANPGRHRIDAYGSDGNLKSFWGKASMKLEGFCGCCNPTAFALWPGGGFITSEKGLTRVKRHAPDGSIKDVVATPKMFQKKTRIFDIDVNTEGVVFVLDNDRKQVRMFSEQTAKPAGG